MSPEPDSVLGEPNVFRSIWNRRWLVLACIGVFAVLGVLITSLRPPEYAAEAAVVLEDPQSTVTSDGRIRGDEFRYVSDQVAILKSIPVAARASVLASANGNSSGIEARDLQRKTSIRSSADSNYIVIRFRAGDPTTAAAGANAIVRAYRQLIRLDLDEDAKAALQRLDAAIAEGNRTLEELTRAGAGTAPPQSILSQRRQDTLALLSELRSRRTRLHINSELVGDGVTLFSPAGPGKAQGVSVVAALVTAIVLGGLIAAGLAYGLDARRRAFSNWLEPQGLLDAPALAEIPDFTGGSAVSKLPVLHAPGSEAAEAFRFLASGIGASGDSSKGAARPRDDTGRFAPRSSAHRSVAFVSAAHGDGTTTVVANTALAAAQEGLRVLALDADVESHGLTHLLLGRALMIDGEDVTAVGLSNMLRNRASADGIQRVMGTGAGGTLSLLGPGTATRRRGVVFRSEEIVATLTSIRDQFDLVLIDVPPDLQVAYADAVLRSAGSVVAVIRHRSEAARVKHVSDRLDLLGIRAIGYAYNFSPPRQEVGRSVTDEVRERAENVIARARAKKEAAV